MSVPLSSLAAIPHGRMASVRQLEAALLRGETYECASARAGVSASAAKQWASTLSILKRHLNAETAEDRIVRYTGWVIGLTQLKRYEEAALFETEARKLETLLGRVDKRVASSAGTEAAGPRDDRFAPARVLLDRVAATIGPQASRWEAWNAISVYYGALRDLGAELSADGRAHFADGLPATGLPDCPAWLPGHPWAVSDEAAWTDRVGAGLMAL